MVRAGGGEDTSLGDRVLLARARDGSEEDYGLLFERHRAMALRFARSKLSDPGDADDVVAEVFASVLATIKRGGGPVDVFVPYLMTSLRNECQRVNQQHVRQLAVAVKEHSAAATGHDIDVATRDGELGVVRDAFQSLPAKFQDVLWRVEVDEETYEALASRYSMTAHAVAMLTMRARRALASAYLDRHRPLPRPGHVTDTACRDVAHDLTGLTRGTLSSRRRHKVEAHLAQCDSCRNTQTELGRINQHLRVLPIAPLALLADTVVIGTKAGIKSSLSTWWATAAPVVTSGVAAITVVSPVLLSGADGHGVREPTSHQQSESDGDTDSQPAAPTASSSPATTTSSTHVVTTTTSTTAPPSTSTIASGAPTSTVTPVTGAVAPAAGTGAERSPTPASGPRRTLPSVTLPRTPPTTSSVSVPAVTAPPGTVVVPTPPSDPPVTLPEPVPTSLPTTPPLTTTEVTTSPLPP